MHLLVYLIKQVFSSKQRTYFHIFIDPTYMHIQIQTCLVLPTYFYVHTRLLKAQCIVCTYLYIFAPKRPCAKTARAKTAAPNRSRQNVLIRFAGTNTREI